VSFLHPISENLWYHRLTKGGDKDCKKAIIPIEDIEEKLRIVIQGKIKEIVTDCDPSGVSDIKKHLKRKFIEKPSQDDKGMEKDENNHVNTPLDTEHHHYHYTRTNSQKLTQTRVTKFES
jgi:hypothetical protein